MIQQINEDNFKELDPKLLLDARWYQDVENMVISIDAAGTADYAKMYMESLAEKLDSAGDQMGPNLRNKYLRLLKALKLCTLSLLTDQEKAKFFREELLDVIQLDFTNIQLWVDQTMRLYYQAPDIMGQIKSNLLAGLENSLQRIGNQNIKLKTQDAPVAPTIKNWLVDYRSFAQTNPGKIVRGTLEEVSFTNQGSNSKLLSGEDRKLLLKVLKLYDWLSFHEFKYDFSFPGEKIEDDNKMLEGETHELISQESVDAVNKVRTGVQKAPAAVPKPQPVVQRAAPAVVPAAKPSSDFERKLGQVTAPHGQDLEVLKRQLTRPPAPPVPVMPPIRMTPQEIKREVGTPELPKHMEPVKAQTSNSMPTPPVRSATEPHPLRGEGRTASLPQQTIPSPRPDIPNLHDRAKIGYAPGLKSLSDIKTVDDLKKIELYHLRQGPMQSQIANIKFQISKLAQANNLLPYYTVLAFEESPLFKAYIQSGGAKMRQTQDGGELNQVEFEALADLRKELERL